MLRAGIIGLPNVGKSTLFNALVQSHKAHVANYPFTTIDPNIAVVMVPDPRLSKLAQIVGSATTVPAHLEFADIAGLVKGASHGEGLGNQFLAHIREADILGHVVRCFADENVAHIDKDLDPVRDIEIVTIELCLADLVSLEKRAERLTKIARSGDKTAGHELEIIARFQNHLNTGQPAVSLALNEEDRALAKNFFLLTMKPTVYIANVSEGDLSHPDNPLVANLQQYASRQRTEMVLVSARIEEELIDLTSDERSEYLRDLGRNEPSTTQLIEAVYRALDLITFFTANEKEARARPIRRGANALAAAAEVHTDFARGFITAETVAFDDLVRAGSLHSAREQGHVRHEGKSYVIRDGEVLFFRFNV